MWIAKADRAPCAFFTPNHPTVKYNHQRVATLIAIFLVTLSIQIEATYPSADNSFRGDQYGSSRLLSPNESDQITPISGIYNVIAIHVQFSDLWSNKTTKDTTMYMKDYWLEVSYNRFMVEVYYDSSWITLSKPYSHYSRDEGEEWGEIDVNIVDFTKDALGAADPMINFAIYQAVIIVHAGQDQITSKNTEDIWSQWVGYGEPYVTNEGSTISRVAVVSEDDPKGTWIHEFAHLLGLPDLYNIDELQGEDDFVGGWDVMAVGGWNGYPQGSSPAHLMSWEKIKLGWIPGSQVEVVEMGDSVQTLISPLESGTGTLALKLSLSPTLYYLVEVREKTGFDTYLPGEGVLILYVDESLSTGKGIVKVVRKEGEDPDGSALGIGWYLEDNASDWKISIESTSGSAYLVRAYYAPPTYTLSVSTELPGIVIVVDGASLSADTNGEVRVTQRKGYHTIALMELYQEGDLIRHYFEEWEDGSTSPNRTLYLTSDTAITASYRSQYAVLIEPSYDAPVSFFNNDTYWYDAGSYASIWVTETPIIDADTKYIFEGWSGDYSGNDVNFTILMNSPKRITMLWKVQYYLHVDSQFGNASGNGWYDSRATAMFSVDEESIPVADWSGALGAKYVFDGWAGDYDGKILTGSLVMDGPKTVVARWMMDYGQTYLNVSAIILITGTAVFVLRRVKKRAEPQTIPPPPEPSMLTPPPPPASPTYIPPEYCLSDHKGHGNRFHCNACKQSFWEYDDKIVQYCELCGAPAPSLVETT